MASRFRSVVWTLAIGALLAGCGQESGPWVAISGGGFVVNYSGGLYKPGAAQAYYGFSVKPLRRLPAGTVLEAQFEDPAGGPVFVDRKEVADQQTSYAFRSPYLKGIEVSHPYHAEIHVLEAGSHKLLASYGRSFTSKVDDAWLAK